MRKYFLKKQTKKKQKKKNNNKRAKMALYLLPDYQTSLKSIRLSVQEKFNIDFQNSNHLGFPIRMILTTFDLQITSIPQVKFQVNWPFGSG